MAIHRLMVVEDDTEMRQMLTAFLQQSGFSVVGMENQRQVEAHLAQNRVDLILLDVMLGAESGVDLCARLRTDHDVPIIMLSALSADHQRMKGYASGADDYIAKPFNPELLVARIKAVLRRNRRAASLTYRRNTRAYHFAGWHYDARLDQIFAPDGFEVALSKRESNLLKAFLANPHIPLNREEIAEALDIARDGAGALAAKDSRAIDVLVGRLRSKIEQNPKDPQMIRTERGTGYVLAVDVEARDGT